MQARINVTLDPPSLGLAGASSVGNPEASCARGARSLTAVQPTRAQHAVAVPVFLSGTGTKVELSAH